jgi:hypothetical protein
MTMYEFSKKQKYLDNATHAGYVLLSYMVDWDIPMPPSKLEDHGFKSRDWTVVSAQNQHLDAFGLFFTPEFYKLGMYLHDENLKRMAILMFRSCGQMIDPFGSHGEQYNTPILISSVICPTSILFGAVMLSTGRYFG